MSGERALPGLGLRGFHTAATGGWGDPLSEDLRELSAVVQLSVGSRTTAIASQANGTILIVPSGAGSNPNKIAVRDNGAWVYFTPHEGMTAYVQDEDIYVRWTGTAWEQSGQFYDMNFFVPGKPGNNEIIGKLKAVRPFAIAPVLEGSYGDAEVSATASSVFTLKKNGTDFGTITFGVGATVGTLASASGASFAVGDKLTLVGPATADTTLADICFSLKVRLL